MRTEINPKLLNWAFDQSWELKPIQDFDQNRFKSFWKSKNQSSFLHVLTSKIFEFYVEIGEWKNWGSREESLPKFSKIEISKNFQFKNTDQKCLFLMCFFQLSFLNFRIESFQDFFRMSIPKSKMHFLGVWRKKIFYEVGVGFMFWAMEFFILGLGEIFENFDQNLNENQFETFEQSWWTRTFSKTWIYFWPDFWPDFWPQFG